MCDEVSNLIGPAEILAARFDNQDDIDVVGLRIKALGYDPAELSFISDAKKCSFTFDGVGDHAAKATVEGIVGGSALGTALSAGAAVLGAGGLVVLGPIGLLAGAAVGSVSGLLLGLGFRSDQSAACENAVNSGAVVMTVQAHAGDSAVVRAALGEHLIASESDRYTGKTTPPIHSDQV